MSAIDLPPGVVLTPRAGLCEHCGTPYSTGTQVRRYGDGFRPTACGCHPVVDRAQTAPTQVPAAEAACWCVGVAGQRVPAIGCPRHNEQDVRALVAEAEQLDSLQTERDELARQAERHVETRRVLSAQVAELSNTLDRYRREIATALGIVGDAPAWPTLIGGVALLVASEKDPEGTTAPPAPAVPAPVPAPAPRPAAPVTRPVTVTTLPNPATLALLCITCQHPRRLHDLDGKDTGCRRTGCSCGGFDRPGVD